MNVLWVYIRNQLDRIFFQRSQVGTVSNIYDGAFLWKQEKLGFFDRIWTEYEEILHICRNSVQMRENTGQENSEYGPFVWHDPEYASGIGQTL